MGHQILALWLAAVLLGAGQVEAPCPQGNCWLARAMSCCQHDGITRSGCCPPLQQLGARAVAATENSPLAKAKLLATGGSALVAVRTSAAMPAAARSGMSAGAPPGTLFGQRTSLVL